MRHRLTPIIVVLSLLFGSAIQFGAYPAQIVAEQRAAAPLAPVASQDGISIYFSPKGGCTDAIVDQLSSATKSIQLQAYSFTSQPIAEALLAAHKRGVKVAAILDKSQRGEQYSSATFLMNQGMATFIDSTHAIAHNKIILIDGRTIITGSFNFSKAAEESNAENLLIIQDKVDLYRAYEKNFADHLAHSTPYAGLDQPAVPARAPAASEPVSPSSTPSDVSAAKVTLREGITASAAEESLARQLKAAGWEYVMPRPKSPQAAWGNHDGRTTWYSGYWKNSVTKGTSSVQPKEDDKFKGDGLGSGGWRKGGSPAAPSRMEWLCSTSGGIQPK